MSKPTRVTHHLVNMIELLGEQQGETTIKDTALIMLDKTLHTYSIEITSYQNGSYRYIAWNGCFDHIYTYYGLAFHEAYHQMMSCYLGAFGDENFFIVDVPTFIEKKDSQYLFEGSDATVEVILRQREDGYWETYSYDCT